MDMAYRAAQRLNHPLIEANMGCFLLGSTSPDIRVITRGHRQEYHFAPLDFEGVGAGVRGLFEAHPQLRNGSQDGPTRAFLAGYLTHIILDETWIVEMFRPYFANRELFADEARAMVMDRALQLELDRQGWGTVDAKLPDVQAMDAPICVGFIPNETIYEWRDWIVNFIARGFSWDRLLFMARRIAAGDEGHASHRIAEDFVHSMPSSLDSLFECVPRERLSEFRGRALDSVTRVVEEFLP